MVSVVVCSIREEGLSFYRAMVRGGGRGAAMVRAWLQCFPGAARVRGLFHASRLSSGWRWSSRSWPGAVDAAGGPVGARRRHLAHSGDYGSWLVTN